MRRNAVTLPFATSAGILVVFLNGLIRDCDAQSTYEKIYGTPLYDVANSMETTADHGFILVGLSGAVFDTCNSDFALVKCDADGTIQWTQTYKTPACDQGLGIKQTPDHGYLATGVMIDTPSISKMVLLKTDSTGQIEWQYFYSSNDHDEGIEVYPVTNNEYLIPGYRYDLNHFEYDVTLTRIDENGNVLWSKVYATQYGAEYGYIQIFDNQDGTYFLTCTQVDLQSFPTNENFYILHIDGDGNVLTSKVYGNSDQDEKGWGLFKIDANRYWVTGMGGPQSHTDALLLQIDSSGNLLWAKVYSDGLYAADESSVTSFSYIPEFGLYVCGFDVFYDPYTFILDKGDAFVLHVGDNGAVNWWKDYGEPAANNWEEFFRIKVADDGNLLMAGARTTQGNYFDQNYWDMYVVKANKNGVDGCETNKNVTVTDWNVDVADVPVTATDLSLVQTAASFVASSEIELTTLCSGVSTHADLISNDNDFYLYPNPANASVTISNSSSLHAAEIKFYSIIGEEILHTKNLDAPVNFSAQPDGIYTYRVFAENGSIVKTGKICIQH